MKYQAGKPVAVFLLYWLDKSNEHQICWDSVPGYLLSYICVMRGDVAAGVCYVVQSTA